MQMNDPVSPVSEALRLRAGEWVQVRSAEEIFATLDGHGCLEALPFMPEMLKWCGKTVQVQKSAHKTCDTIGPYGTLRMSNAVHLTELRCDGAAHGGCEAACLIFWKEAWLRRSPGPAQAQPKVDGVIADSDAPESAATSYNVEGLQRATRAQTVGDKAPSERYRCQATELPNATTRAAWWDPRLYVKDLTSGNVGPFKFIRYSSIALFNMVMRLHWRGRPYPYLRGLAGDKTPTEELNLQVGELVEVRSKREIMLTLNEYKKNRGLSFDVEMVPFCGRKFRVLRRVEKIINEKTGKMMRLPSACLILENATCGGCLSRKRLFCPRAIYPYWHEIWLKRVQ